MGCRACRPRHPRVGRASARQEHCRMAKSPGRTQVRPTVRRGRFSGNRLSRNAQTHPGPAGYPKAKRFGSGRVSGATRSRLTHPLYLGAAGRPQRHRRASDVAVTSTETTKLLAHTRPEQSPPHCRRGDKRHIADREPGSSSAPEDRRALAQGTSTACPRRRRKIDRDRLTF